jgi:hypothetical protein
MKSTLILIALLPLAGCASSDRSGLISGPIMNEIYGPATTAPAPSATTAPAHAVTTANDSMLNMPAEPGGIDRYGLDQATGPVINGVHHGIPAGPPKKTCHGAIVGGVCTGPEF